MVNTENGGDALDTICNVTSLFEKLTDLNFAMVLVPTFFALDSALSAISGTNILNTNWPDLLSRSIGPAICVIAGYTFVFARGIPLLQGVCGFLILNIVNFVQWIDRRITELLVGPNSEGPCFPREGRVAGSWVKLNVARDEALRDRDSFWISRVEAREAEVKSSRQKEASLAKLSFAAFSFALIDFYAFPNSSILGAVLEYMTTVTGISTHIAEYSIDGAILVLGLPWLAKTLDTHSDQVWIHHPSLAEKLMQAHNEKVSDERRLRQLGRLTGQ